MEKEPLTEYQQEGLELHQRLGEAEHAFEEAFGILSLLDKEENREKLAESLRSDNYDVQASDFEGAYLLQLKSEDLQKEFGVSFFPLNVVIPSGKWGDYAVRMRKENSHGFFIRGQSQTDPFDKVGISFWDSDFVNKYGVSAHEDMHRVYNHYSPFKISLETEGPLDEYPRSLQRSLIDEINACRVSIKKGHMSWHDLNLTVHNQLDEIIQNYDDKKMWDQTRQKLDQACQTTEYLEKNLPASVVTHILINCESLDDLNAWQRVKPEEFKELLGGLK